MFTIKHVDRQGNETLVQCHRFVRERRSDGYTQFVALGENAVPMEYIATWCGDCEQGVTHLGAWHTIYVMNQQGSTVAVYRFAEPDFSAGCEQADPELAQAA